MNRLLPWDLSPLHLKGSIVILATVAAAFAAVQMKNRTAASKTPLSMGGSCSTCSIDVVKKGTIEDSEGPGAFSEPIAMAYGAGSIYLVPDRSMHSILRFGNDGKFISRLEKRGQGPGEFQAVLSMAFANGSLHVLDQGNYRYTVLSSDLRVQREAALQGLRPIELGIVVTDSGHLVVNGIARMGNATAVLHEVDTLGIAMRSFDVLDPRGEQRGALASPEKRMLAPSKSDRVWASEYDEYDVSLWQLDPPEKLLHMRPHSSWFVKPAAEVLPRRGGPEPRTWLSPPPPVILGLQEDTAGLLWVLGRVTKHNWKRYQGDRSHIHEMFSSVVDVIDPKSRQVVASVQLPFFGLFAGQRLIGAYHEDAEGRPSIELYELRLRGYTQTKGELE